MRRILIMSLAAGLLATSMMSARAGAAQQPLQASPGKKAETSRKPAVHYAARSKYRKTARKHGAKPTDHRPDYQQNAVEVMNGSSTRRVVFDDENKPVETAKGEPSQLKVEVMNGNSTDTRYFNLDQNAPQTEAAMNKQPVVVGIQSSNTRFAGGDRHPVVMSITSAGQDNATKSGVGGQKLMKGVAPQLKRPPYEPEVH